MTEENQSQGLESSNSNQPVAQSAKQSIPLIDIDIPPVLLKSVQTGKSADQGKHSENSAAKQRDLEPLELEKAKPPHTRAETAEAEMPVPPKKVPRLILPTFRPHSIRSYDGRKGRSYAHGKGQRATRGFRISFDGLVRHFAACARCSYFLTAVRAIVGDPHIDELIKKLEDGWMPIVWNVETRQLLQRSFGVRTDVGYFFIEHSCDLCQRRIVYEQQFEEEDDIENLSSENGTDHEASQSDTEYFWIEIKHRR
ncbi:MAG: hypothetical protein AAF633_20325 [Chloroflexota bacterium]